jgi:hypothetical protein
MEIINNKQLYNRKYNILTLEGNMALLELNIVTLMRTQKLTSDFCVKYLIFNEEFSWCDEETYICDNTIILYQPHISQEDLINSREKLNL